jgi:hypothetical protein
MPRRPPPKPLLLPDAGPLITLAYANQLDLLQRPGWPLRLVDMVLYEVTRNPTPSRDAIRRFVEAQRVTLIETQVGRRYQRQLAAQPDQIRRAGLGELAIQEAINTLALKSPAQPAVFLFEDHKIARTSFHLPDGTLRVSTRAFLLFLEQQGHIDSAAEIEHAAITAGRSFSRLRFP